MQEILQEDEIEERLQEVHELYNWLTIESFDRPRVNKRLTQYASGDENWMFN